MSNLVNEKFWWQGKKKFFSRCLEDVYVVILKMKAYFLQKHVHEASIRSTGWLIYLHNNVYNFDEQPPTLLCIFMNFCKIKSK